MPPHHLIYKGAPGMKRLVGATAVLVSFAVHAAAQDAARSALVGRVTDSSGAIVAHASVKAASAATGLVREAASDTGGYFTVPSLPPGDYAVTVEASGF